MKKMSTAVLAGWLLGLMAGGCGPSGDTMDAYIQLLAPDDINEVTGQARRLEPRVIRLAATVGREVCVEFVAVDYRDKTIEGAPGDGFVDMKITRVQDVGDDIEQQLEGLEARRLAVAELSGIGDRAVRFRDRFRDVVLAWHKARGLRIRISGYNKRHASFERDVTYDAARDTITKGAGTFVTPEQLERLAAIALCQIE